MSSSLIEEEKIGKMKDLEEIERIIKNHKPLLKKNFRVKDIGVFGSYARGEQGESSDLDVLVEFDRRIGFFKFLELEEYLQQLLRVKVDLVTKKALKPRIGRNILKEVIML